MHFHSQGHEVGSAEPQPARKRVKGGRLALVPAHAHLLQGAGALAGREVRPAQIPPSAGLLLPRGLKQGRSGHGLAPPKAGRPTHLLLQLGHFGAQHRQLGQQASAHGLLRIAAHRMGSSVSGGGYKGEGRGEEGATEEQAEKGGEAAPAHPPAHHSCPPHTPAAAPQRPPAARAPPPPPPAPPAPPAPPPPPAPPAPPCRRAPPAAAPRTRRARQPPPPAPPAPRACPPPPARPSPPPPPAAPPPAAPAPPPLCARPAAAACTRRGRPAARGARARSGT